MPAQRLTRQRTLGCRAEATRVIWAYQHRCFQTSSVLRGLLTVSVISGRPSNERRRAIASLGEALQWPSFYLRAGHASDSHEGIVGTPYRDSAASFVVRFLPSPKAWPNFQEHMAFHLSDIRRLRAYRRNRCP